MPYSNFSRIADVARRYALKTGFLDLPFAEVQPPSEPLLYFLQKAILDPSTRSEAARCERLISPVMMEITDIPGIGFWSHETIAVPNDEFLKGEPDFVIATRDERIQEDFRAPFLSIIEIKRGDEESGWPQCLAAMVACQILNHQGERDPLKWHGEVAGVVSDGFVWRFARLVGDSFLQARKTLDINDDLPRILGFLRQEVVRLAKVWGTP